VEELQFEGGCGRLQLNDYEDCKKELSTTTADVQLMCKEEKKPLFQRRSFFISIINVVSRESFQL
jgi:hypothetical protein